MQLQKTAEALSATEAKNDSIEIEGSPTMTLSCEDK